MERPEFIYVIYIAATAEAVYAALTSPEDTRYYWGHRNVSDWRVGSRWRHERQDGTASVVGRVLEASRPQRLRLSWSPPDADGDPNRTSEVEFDIQGTTGFSRLTVTHMQLDPRNHARVASGWAKVLSNLKTWLEKREVLPGLVDPGTELDFVFLQERDRLRSRGDRDHRLMFDRLQCRATAIAVEQRFVVELELHPSSRRCRSREYSLSSQVRSK